MPEIGGIKVSVTGAKSEASLTKEVISNEINRNVERWSKFSRINNVNIDIKRLDKGGKTSYCVRIEATGEGSFHADAEEWSLENAMHEALDMIGRELLKKRGKNENLLRRLFSRKPRSG